MRLFFQNSMSPAQQKYQAILFDFDGTLLDSFPAHYQAYEVTMAHFGLHLAPSFYKENCSPDWYQLYRALDIPEARWPEANEVWLEEASKHQPLLFAGTQSLLLALKSRYTLGLVTSGSRSRVVRDLAANDIEELFQVIVTGDDVSRPKPDPEGMQTALSELGLLPGDALYIGDAREDYLMAQAAGVSFIGIAGEYATVTAVEGCIHLDCVSELCSYLEP